MALSVLELYSVGSGPSSSDTVGPIRAAHACHKKEPLETVKAPGLLFEERQQTRTMDRRITLRPCHRDPHRTAPHSDPG